MSVLEKYRKLENEFLEILEPYPKTHSGRGIVTACGSKDCFCIGAYVQIRLLRKFGCSLPVEVWKFEWEKDAKWDDLFNSLEGVEVRYYNDDIANVERRGWTLKPYAIRESKFKEVMFLDSDVAPTKNPEYLFEYDLYKERGAIFWSDTCRTHIKVKPTAENSSKYGFWHMAGVPEINEREFESGQIVINKEKCWKQINLTCHYNNLADFYYSLFLGDKETFHLAWRRSKKDFVFFDKTDHVDVPGGKFFWQYDMNGELIFQHRSGNKFEFQSNLTEPRFVEQEFIFDCIDELKSIIYSG
jgi:alpha 1,2-mannosyltransferase